MDEFKLYEYEDPKPTLEDVLAHHGIKGQKHGVRNGPPYPLSSKLSTGKRLLKQAGGGIGKIVKKRIKKKPATENAEQAIQRRDLKYMQKHKDQFSTKELNDVMNRIDTEQRLDRMANQSSSKTKQKIQKIIKSPAFKAAGAIAVAGLGYAAYKYYEGVNASVPRLPDKSVPYAKQFGKDIVFGAGEQVKKKLKKKIPI